MDPKEIITGLDEETLEAIAQFSGEYMEYLWWKEVIIPTAGNVFLCALLAFVIGFLARCVVQSYNDGDGEKAES
jgi:hypothetical protein